MGVDAWGFEVERQALARRLRSRRILLSLTRQICLLSFFVVLLLGGSTALRTWAMSIAVPHWAATAIFLLALFLLGSAISFPFSYVSSFRWETQVGLTSRTFGSWLRDLAKSLGLGAAFTIIAGEVLLWLIAGSADLWWVVAWALGLLVSIVLGSLAPVLLVPLFYRFRPIKDEALRARFQALAASAGTPVIGVFELEMSPKTRRSNAAVMGFGRTRRIVLTDTLLQEYCSEEIETVLAHELAHQKHRDPWTGFAISAGSSLLVLWIAAVAYNATFRGFGITVASDMAGLPLLALYGGLVSAGLGPAELWWSRRRERSADRFALELTKNPTAFASAMVKLHDKNLGVAHPRRFEIWLFYSHPSGRERVDIARAFAAPR